MQLLGRGSLYLPPGVVPKSRVSYWWEASIRKARTFASIFCNITSQNWREGVGREIPKLALGLQGSETINDSKMLINDCAGVDTCPQNF